MISIDTSLAQFNARFARYAELNKRMPDELLEKKGRALGIALFKGFREHQFGGSPKNKGIAAEEFRARVSRGRAKGNGILVRDSLRERYEQGRDFLTFSMRSAGQSARYATLKADRQEAKRDGRAARKRRANLWQKAVSMELAARESGIGVLAASFLWFRKRSNNARGTFLVPNRTGKPLGYVERTANAFRIVGETEGLAATDAKHSVIVAAINSEMADLDAYIARKEMENREASGL